MKRACKLFANKNMIKSFFTAISILIGLGTLTSCLIREVENRQRLSTTVLL